MINDPFILSPALMQQLRARGGAASARMALDAAVPAPGLATTAAVNQVTFLSLGVEVTVDAGRSLLRGNDPVGGFFGFDTLVAMVPVLAEELVSPNVFYPLASALAPITYLVDGPGPEPALRFAAGGGLSFAPYPLYDFDPGAPWSLDLWLRTTQDPGAPADVLDKTDAGTWPFRLRLMPGATLEGSYSDGTNTATVQTVEAVDDGEWHYLSLVKRPSDLVIQLDDTDEVVVADPVTGSGSNAVALTVAQSALVADLADFGVYGLALTSAQRNRHRAATLHTPVTP